MKTGEDNDTKGIVLSRNLIQSFIFGKFGDIEKRLGQKVYKSKINRELTNFL